MPKAALSRELIVWHTHMKKVQGKMRIFAIVLGVLGGIIGLVSAISAFVAVGADPAYSARIWAGWLALVLAALAGVAAIFITRRPFAAILTMLISGVLGFLSINLFYINTFYVLAIVPWLIAAALAVLTARSHTSEKRPSGNV
jgi:hypothetical protein